MSFLNFDLLELWEIVDHVDVYLFLYIWKCILFLYIWECIYIQEKWNKIYNILNRIIVN